MAVDARPGESTRETILRVALAHAGRVGTDAIRIEDVLDESGASASSLYHHFGNRAGLLDAVRARQIRDGLREEDPSQLELQVTSHAGFCDYIAGHLRRAVTDPAAQARRRNRITTLVAGFESAAASEAAATAQGALLQAITDMIREAIALGLCNPDLDAEAYVAFFHSLSLGRILTEPGLPDHERWLAVAIPAALAPLALPGTTAADPDSPAG